MIPKNNNKEYCNEFITIIDEINKYKQDECILEFGKIMSKKTDNNRLNEIISSYNEKLLYYSRHAWPDKKYIYDGRNYNARREITYISEYEYFNIKYDLNKELELVKEMYELAKEGLSLYNNLEVLNNGI